jgi:hypothetical protein
MNNIKIEERFFKEFLKVEKQLKAVNPSYEDIKYETLVRDGGFLLIFHKHDDLLQTYIDDLCTLPQLIGKIKVV